MKASILFCLTFTINFLLARGLSFQSQEPRPNLIHLDEDSPSSRDNPQSDGNANSVKSSLQDQRNDMRKMRLQILGKNLSHRGVTVKIVDFQ